MPSESITRLRKLQKKALVLLDEKHIDSVDHRELSRAERFAHFWALVVRGFVRNRGPARASALAYTTLLALIPLLAIALSFSTNLLTKEDGKPIQDLIDKFVASVAPALNLEVKTDGADIKSGSKEIASRIKDYIGNIRSGTLSVTSIVVLVFVAISLLRTIESTFNDIWGVTRGRTWGASIVRYWAAISLGPLILIVAIGLTTGSQLTATQRAITEMPYLGQAFLKLFPFVLLSFAFALLYHLMPNTRVQWKAALAGGTVSGCLWQLNNLFNVIYVSNVVTYSKIYGSLGIFPVFLIGLYLSWLILLFGGQVAYAFQNRQTYLQERQAERVHQRGREFLALRLMTYIGQRFQEGARAPSLSELAEHVDVPSQLLCQVLCVLVENGLLQEIADKEVGFTLRRPLEKISCQDILQAMRVGRGEEIKTRDEPARVLVHEEFQRIYDIERQAAETVTLQELVTKARTAES